MVPVVGAMSRFVMVPRLRLLHVVTDSDLRIPVLEHIAAAEHHRNNRSPFVVLEAPVEVGDIGWSTRVEELREELEASRGEEDESPPQPRANRRPPGPSALEGTGDLRVFGLELAEALRSLPEHLDGLTIVLAPLRVEAQARWVSDLLALVTARELERARFIVVDLGAPISALVTKRLGEAAAAVDARLDDDSAREGLRARVASMGAAPDGATGARLLGGAGPRVAPPPRGEVVADADAATEQRGCGCESLARAGLPEGLSRPGVGRELGSLMLGAALALRRGDPVEAVRDQRGAMELCRREGLVRESILLELMLASALVQLKRPELALETIEEARSRADDEELHELVIQALLARAMVQALEKRPMEAAETYERAGRLAQERGFAVLAIEAYRVCGQILVAQDRIDLGVASWKRALELADGSDPELVSQSSAAEMARTLASLCRKHGLTDRALELEARAETFENPPPPPQKPEPIPVPEHKPEPKPEPLPPATNLQPAASSLQPDLHDTLEMVVVGLFPDEEEAGAEALGEAEAEIRAQHNREWAREVAAMSTMVLPAVEVPLRLESNDASIFAPVDLSAFRRDPRLAATEKLDAVDEPAERPKQPLSRWRRWFSRKSVEPDTTPTPPRHVQQRSRDSELFATVAIPAVVLPGTPHHTQRPSMEMDAEVLPEEGETEAAGETEPDLQPPASSLQPGKKR